MALPQFLRIILGTTIFCVLLLQASIANAISAPLQTIQTAVERVVEVLSATENQGEAQRQKRLAEVGTIIRPLFDRQEVAKRTLGFHWKDRTEQQREEFINIFRVYEEAKDVGQRDYNDILINFLKIKNPPVFKYVLIDELQDVNDMEADIAL